MVLAELYKQSQKALKRQALRLVGRTHNEESTYTYLVMPEHALCCAVWVKASDVQDGFHGMPELKLQCAQYLGGLTCIFHASVSQPAEQYIMMAGIGLFF